MAATTATETATSKALDADAADFEDETAGYSNGNCKGFLQFKIRGIRVQAFDVAAVAAFCGHLRLHYPRDET